MYEGLFIQARGLCMNLVGYIKLVLMILLYENQYKSYKMIRIKIETIENTCGTLSKISIFSCINLVTVIVQKFQIFMMTVHSQSE